jgi:hypothetical protein
VITTARALDYETDGASLTFIAYAGDGKGGEDSGTYTIGVGNVGEGVQVQNVGVWNQSGAASNYTSAITAAGLTPTAFSGFSQSELDKIDGLLLERWGDLSASEAQLLTGWVAEGNVLVFHDWFPNNADRNLPGLANAHFETYDNGVITGLTGPMAQMNFVNDAGQVANGPGGVLTDASLDGGNYSNHGAVHVNTLPAEARAIITRDDPNEATLIGVNHGME